MSEWLSDADRFWLDTMDETISIVRTMFFDRALLLMLAGAVFALHQDMLKAREIDMRKVEMFRERVRSTIKALYDIDDANLDLLEQELPCQTYHEHALPARMRSTAARIWLLTTYAAVAESFGTKPTSATILNLGIGNLWMMLGAVNRHELRENANFFTGTYFSDVRSKSMNLKHWPHRPEAVEPI